MKRLFAVLLSLLIVTALCPVLAEYTDADTILAVQQALADAGYYKGNISGIKGNATENAIRNYQKANGMRSNGIIDDSLLEMLGLNGEIDIQLYMRAVLVVATNSQATDIYKSDRMTIDKDKLHKYSDTDGFYLNFYSDGNWKANGDKSWVVDSMILKSPIYGNYMQVSCVITYSAGSFKVTSMKKVISSKLEFSDPNKSSFISESDDEIYMTVPMSFVKEDR